MHKKLKPPMTRRRFATIWGELDYLCQKIRYWLYTRNQKFRVELYLYRLERVLRDLPENDLAIIREEGLALLYELNGKTDEAIAQRRREIRLTERLQAEARSSRYSLRTKAYMLQGRDTAGLQERRAILEALMKAKAQQSGGLARTSRSMRFPPKEQLDNTQPRATRSY